MSKKKYKRPPKLTQWGKDKPWSPQQLDMLEALRDQMVYEEVVNEMAERKHQNAPD